MTNKIFQSRPNPSYDICLDFKEVAIRTWDILGNAYHYDTSIGEETITDINLLELKMRQPTSLYTKQFTRRQEGRNGADWMWIIIGRTGRTFMLYVQAKKLFVRDMSYNSLIHSAANPTEQIDKLILNKFFYPLGFPVYPIYVFYNYIPDHNPGIICNCGSRLFKKEAGCSYADAFEVRKRILAGQKSWNDLYDIQYAWSCLVCCGGNGNSKGSGNSDLATNFYNRIVNEDTFTKNISNDIKEIPELSNLNPKNFLLEKAPDFVEQILAGKELEVNPFKELGVNRIVVFKEEADGYKE